MMSTMPIPCFALCLLACFALPVGEVGAGGTEAMGTGNPTCPEGYRLHYQGMCINMADEQADDPARGVRMVEPETAPLPDISVQD